MNKAVSRWRTNEYVHRSYLPEDGGNHLHTERYSREWFEVSLLHPYPAFQSTSTSFFALTRFFFKIITGIPIKMFISLINTQTDLASKFVQLEFLSLFIKVIYSEPKLFELTLMLICNHLGAFAWKRCFGIQLELASLGNQVRTLMLKLFSNMHLMFGSLWRLLLTHGDLQRRRNKNCQNSEVQEYQGTQMLVYNWFDRTGNVLESDVPVKVPSTNHKRCRPRSLLLAPGKLRSWYNSAQACSWKGGRNLQQLTAQFTVGVCSIFFQAISALTVMDTSNSFIK